MLVRPHEVGRAGPGVVALLEQARLVLILANQIGDPAILAEALVLARGQLAGLAPANEPDSGGTS